MKFELSVIIMLLATIIISINMGMKISVIYLLGVLSGFLIVKFAKRGKSEQEE